MMTENLALLNVRRLIGLTAAVILAASFVGCACPQCTWFHTCCGLQKCAPVGGAPLLAGPHACPKCGLLPHQGCCCRPSPWCAGYHETTWRPLCACEPPRGVYGTMESMQAFPVGDPLPAPARTNHPAAPTSPPAVIDPPMQEMPGMPSGPPPESGEPLDESVLEPVRALPLSDDLGWQEPSSTMTSW